MSKVCPNCQEVFDDNHAAFCSSCGSRLVDMEEPASTLNIGDANAISGGVNINQSKNITSHDVHYHTVQERNKTEKELLQERQNQYHDAVAQLLKGGILTVEARAQLDKLKFNLGLDAATAANIESTVKNEQKTQARAVNDGLSVIGKMALKSAIAAVDENNSQVQGCIAKLAPVCKTTMNEQVHFYYSMLMAACDPQRCVETYEKRTIDSYWLSYWASVAYRKMGNEMEAEGILTEMTGLWQERPEINVVINACLGIWLACKGNLAECQETIIEYLTQTEEAPSDELNDLFHALLHTVGVEEEDSPRFVFYNEHFLQALDEEAELKKAQEAYDNKDYETALAIWNQLAERNNAEAFFNLGRCYYWGLGVSLDYYEAVKWYRKAAELGDGRASFCIGRSYDLGNGLDLDKVEAFNWFKKAAETGIVDAMVPLGVAYMFGNGTTENPQEAIKWWHKAADLGYDVAMGVLGDCYRVGHGVTQDVAEAVKWYRKAADLGNAFAMNNLGCCYMEGIGVTQDKTEGFKWLQKSAELGCADGMVSMGRVYMWGDGTAKNPQEAIKWYRKAADSGKDDAMAELGDCYRDGKGVTQNQTEAVEWYRKAADLGNTDAMCNLGWFYENGFGVTQSYAEAVSWYRKAADLGSRWAMNNLGVCYRDGTGITQNYAEAATLFRKAADLGNHYSMANLGDCYRDGKGVTEDATEAAQWYQKAADLGNEYAKEQLEIMSEGDKVETVVCQCNQIKEPIPEAKFEKAWVTQENERTIGVHFALNITNHRGKVVSFKCTTRSLTRGSTFDKSTNVIHVHEEKSNALNWDDTRWSDWKYFLNESDIKNTLAFDYRNPYELETELSAYDSSNNCIGSYWIRYKVIHEARVIKGNRLLLTK